MLDAVCSRRLSLSVSFRTRTIKSNPATPFIGLNLGIYAISFRAEIFCRVVYSISQFIWGSQSVIMQSAVSSRMSEAILRVAILTTEGGSVAVNKPGEGNHYDCSRVQAD